MYVKSAQVKGGATRVAARSSRGVDFARRYAGLRRRQVWGGRFIKSSVPKYITRPNAAPFHGGMRATGGSRTRRVGEVGSIRTGSGISRRQLKFIGRVTPTRVGTTRARASAVNSAGAVHPHARGDKRNSRDNASNSFRFTPTRVGTTSSRATATPRTTVHPHARGDNTMTTKGKVYVTGSPPRAWGQR